MKIKIKIKLNYVSADYYLVNVYQLTLKKFYSRNIMKIEGKKKKKKNSIMIGCKCVYVCVYG